MLYRFTMLTLLTLTACTASVDATEPDADVAPYDDELADAGPVTPHYADGDPAPLYMERDAAVPPAPVPDPAYDDEPTPVVPMIPVPVEPAPAPPPPVAPPAPPVVVPPPAPVTPPTSCMLSVKQFAVTCATQHLYTYWLINWQVGNVTYNCQVPASEQVQCKRGDVCGVVYTDTGTAETGVCQ